MGYQIEHRVYNNPKPNYYYHHHHHHHYLDHHHHWILDSVNSPTHKETLRERERDMRKNRNEKVIIIITRMIVMKKFILNFFPFHWVLFSFLFPHLHASNASHCLMQGLFSNNLSLFFFLIRILYLLQWVIIIY